MKEFWNQRYSGEDYVYGKEANSYLKDKILKLKPGKILLPAEGEGRNAVFCAMQLWDVTAFDFSSEARRKALSLAQKRKVEINYLNESFDDFLKRDDRFDAIGLIFTHHPPERRSEIHKKLQKFLKPKGHIIIEGFGKEQLNYNSGGPQDIEMLYSKAEITEDFKDMRILEFIEGKVFLNEGNYHQGDAYTIRTILQAL